MSSPAPRLHQSTAKLLLTQCPLVAWKALEGERRQGTKAMRRGTLVDQLVFGGSQYEVVQARLKSGKRKGELATSWQCEEAREMRDEIEARGWVPCLEHELEEARELAGRIKAELILAGLDLAKYELQKTLQWTAGLGVEAEGTPDAVILTDRWAHTLDLKVGEDANPNALDYQVDSMMWDLQGAAYQEAVQHEHGKAGEHWLCRVDAKLKIVGLYPLGQAYMALGLEKWNSAQATWRDCLSTNNWPGFARRHINPPKHIITRNVERGWYALQETSQ